MTAGPLVENPEAEKLSLNAPSHSSRVAPYCQGARTPPTRATVNSEAFDEDGLAHAEWEPWAGVAVDICMLANVIPRTFDT